jgi:hypothetical protein
MGEPRGEQREQSGEHREKEISQPDMGRERHAKLVGARGHKQQQREYSIILGTKGTREQEKP